MARDVYWIPGSVEPGDSISYGALDSAPSEWRARDQGVPDQAFTLITLATYGNYDNSCAVERSNYRVLTSDPTIAPHLVLVSGGQTGCGYLGTEPPCDELRELLSGLADYPVISEDDLSELESEMESESWDDFGRDDFARALGPVLDSLDPAWEHDDLDVEIEERTSLYEIWHAGCDAFNVYGGTGYKIESGGGVYFYTDEWIKRAIEPEDMRYPWSDYSRGARGEVRERLLALARASRSALIPGKDPEADIQVEIGLMALARLLSGASTVVA